MSDPNTCPCLTSTLATATASSSTATATAQPHGPGMNLAMKMLTGICAITLICWFALWVFFVYQFYKSSQGRGGSAPHAEDGIELDDFRHVTPVRHYRSTAAETTDGTGVLPGEAAGELAESGEASGSADVEEYDDIDPNLRWLMRH